MNDFMTMHPKNMGRSSRLAAHIAAKRANAGEPAVGQSRLERQAGLARPASNSASAPKPSPVRAKAETAPTPKVMSAAERAAVDAERQRRLSAEEARRKAIARRTAENRQAKINADWAEVHARAADPLALDEPEDPKSNHGWGAIHAEIRARRGN